MTAPIVHHFGACRVEVWPPAYCQTVFSEMAKVPAAPEATDAYRQTARACGYGDDTALLSLEHELSHTILSLARGLPYSPTLHALAFGYRLPPGQMPAEEAIVLAFQHWSRTGAVDALDTLEQAGWEWRELERLRDQLHALTRQEVPV